MLGVDSGVCANKEYKVLCCKLTLVLKIISTYLVRNCEPRNIGICNEVLISPPLFR